MEHMEIEKLILANCLYNPDLTYDMLNLGLDEAHFTALSHQEIFKALKSGVGTDKSGSADLNEVGEKSGVKVPELLTLMTSSTLSSQIALYEARGLVNTYARGTLLSSLKGAVLELERGLESDKVADNLDERLKNHSTRKSLKVKSFAEILIDFQQDLEAKKHKYDVRTGIEELDPYFNCFQGGELVVIGARPGVGKTALLTQLLLESAKVGTNSVFFSGEMSELEITRRIISQETEIDGRALTSIGLLDNKEVQKVCQATAELSTLGISLLELSGRNIGQFVSTSKRLVAKTGAKIIAVDYLQLIGGDLQKTNRYQEISEVSRRLKLLAMETKTVVIALAQLNRMQNGTLSKEPEISHLRDSGQIEQDANLILLLSKNDANKERINFDVAKNRSGTTGKFAVDFNSSCTKFGQSFLINESETFTQSYEDFSRQLNF